MTAYEIAKYVHILAAIFGMGPVLMLLPITHALQTPGSDTPSTLKWLHVLGKGPQMGGPLLILSGVTMGVLNPTLWSLLWLRISLALFVALLLVIFGVMYPLGEKLRAAATRLDRPNGQAEFAHLARKFHKADILHASVIAAIILLMVTKPF